MSMENVPKENNLNLIQTQNTSLQVTTNIMNKENSCSQDVVACTLPSQQEIGNSEINIDIVKSAATMLTPSNNQDTNNAPTTEFYGKAQKYWAEVPATVNGMLGGLGYISAIDIQGSSVFLRELKLSGKSCALDCGAGIGRVSKNLLMPRFDCVDLVEQDAAFAEKAREYCTTDDVFAKRLGNIYNMGLQEFTPEPEKYDLIWSQWVLGHLTDTDLVAFFQRVKLGLNPKSGVFIMKENITSSKSIEKDEQDSSVTRPLRMYEKCLQQAGFKIIRSFRQQSFPKGLYPVYMIACKPKMAAA